MVGRKDGMGMDGWMDGWMRRAKYLVGWMVWGMVMMDCEDGKENRLAVTNRALADPELVPELELVVQ